MDEETSSHRERKKRDEWLEREIYPEIHRRETHQTRGGETKNKDKGTQ